MTTKQNFGKQPKLDDRQDSPPAADQRPQEGRGDEIEKRAAQTDRTAKTAVQVANGSNVRRDRIAPREKVYIVDELVERSVMAGYTTVVFRPNQVLQEVRDKRQISLAQANNIRLRERD